MKEAIVVDVEAEETIDLPLLFSAYVEGSKVKMCFGKRMDLTDSNKDLWIDFLNDIAYGKTIKITCSVSCKNTLQAQYFLKELKLLKPKQ